MKIALGIHSERDTLGCFGSVIDVDNRDIFGFEYLLSDELLYAKKDMLAVGFDEKAIVIRWLDGFCKE